MIKTLIPLAILLTSTTAYAAGTRPEIAYVKSGTYSEIYLVEPDGTRLRLLYRSKQRMRIFTLDMKPGGGELAFEEVSATASATATLKVLRYDAASTLVATKTLDVCRILSLDYHPSGSDLLFHDTCVGARRLNTTTMTSSPLGIPAGTNKAGWRSANELVYNRSTASASEVSVAPLSDPTNATVVGEVRLAQSMDVSTSGEQLLVDTVDFGTLSLFNMASGTEQQNWQIGHDGRFSPNGLQVAYVTGYDVRGQYIMIRNTTGPGGPSRLAGKGVFGPIDWRN